MKKIVLIPAIVIVLAISVFTIWKLGLIPYELNPQCDLLKAQRGYVICELVKADARNELELGDAGGFPKFYQITKRCGAWENTPHCEFYFRHSGGGGDLGYCVSATGSCEIDMGVFGGATKIDVPNAGQDYYITRVPVGHYITVKANTPLIGDLEHPTLITQFEDYQLVVYDGDGSRNVYNYRSCDLGDFSWVDRDDYCTDGNCPDGTYTDDRLSWGESVNYFYDWQNVPVDITHQLLEKDGQDVYCVMSSTGGEIYNIEQFETRSGCYYYPQNRMAETVDCCPGVESSNSICGDDFQWHPIQIGECDNDADCRGAYGDNYYCGSDHECHRDVECRSDLECPYSGQDYCHATSGGFELVRYGCSGQGECVFEQEDNVDCCPPYDGCEEGQVCDPNSGYTCVNQEGPGEIVCGDGACDYPYENINNCPDDCELICIEEGSKHADPGCCEGSFNLFGYCRNSILSLFSIVGLFVFFIVRSEKALKKKDWYKILINFGITVFLGAICFWVIVSWKKILLGLGIASLLGGAALYFFGGAILVILGTILKLWDMFGGRKK
jgi:hypothetical protein